MATFNNTDEIDATVPQGSRDAADIDTFIQEFKAAFIERYQLEHWSMEDGAAGTSTDTSDSNAQGRHIPGMVGCMGLGTHAAMNALVTADTPPGDGAFWITTDPSGEPDNYDTGTTYRYSSTEGWKPSQLASGTLYASEAEVLAGTVTDKALSPATAEAVYAKYEAIFQDVQTDGTDAGTFTKDAWQTRALAEVTNNITGLSIATNVLTIPAGTYYVRATAPGHRVEKHKCKLVDTDTPTDLLIGTSEWAYNNVEDAVGTQTISVLEGFITLAAETDVELQHYCSKTRNSDGLGVASNFGVDEVYATLYIRTA